MKNSLKLTAVIVFAVLLTSCWSDKSEPNYQYMPDMYKSVGYETYTENPNFKNGMTTQTPADGVIARGQVPYEFEDTTEGYEEAKANLVNPLEETEAHLENGKRNYEIYCALCHGATGAGDGILVQREKFLGVPNYKDRELTEGSIYHVIMYGRNLMGSHASQLTAQERWEVTMYVQQLQSELSK